MDAFQILSRSTNLRKSALRNKSVAQQLPSAGAPAHPQFLSELTSVSEAPESKTGTKRKRSKDSKAADVQNGLNYFNKREDQRTVAGFFQGESETDSNDAFDSATGSKSAALERKSEDVCKSILKAHRQLRNSQEEPSRPNLRIKLLIFQYIPSPSSSLNSCGYAMVSPEG